MLAHIHSLSNDVFTNLAKERILFKSLSEFTHDFPLLLFTYINKPSVVLGRFQNMWHEVSIKIIKFATL